RIHRIRRRRLRSSPPSPSSPPRRRPSAAIAFLPHRVNHRRPPPPRRRPSAAIAVLLHSVADLAPRLIPPTPAPSPTAVLATAIAVLPQHVADPALLSVDLHHGPFRATPEAARQSSGRRWLLSAGGCSTLVARLPSITE
ncbi:Os11g0656100, partial [Oryza sativa Japonica Group]